MRGFQSLARACVRLSSLQPGTNLAAVLALVALPVCIEAITRSAAHSQGLYIFVLAAWHVPRLYCPGVLAPISIHC